MRILSLSDDAISSGFKLFSNMTEQDLEDKGLSPMEVDDFGDVFLAFKTTSEKIIEQAAFPDGFDPDLEDLDDPAVLLTLEKQRSFALSKLVNEMREALQSLYAERGEDDLVKAICDPLIEKSRNV